MGSVDEAPAAGALAPGELLFGEAHAAIDAIMIADNNTATIFFVAIYISSFLW